MTEIILYCLLGILLLYFAIRFYFDAQKIFTKFVGKQVDERVKTTEKLQSDRFKVAYLALEKRIDIKFFNFAKNYNSEIEKNNVANPEEVLQTTQDKPSIEGKDFWKDETRLKDLRDSIAQGNHDEYRGIDSLADLAPLDAWREIDSAIAELEQIRQHPASLGIVES